jgi:beta-barrel assembly-enhancing protease
MHTQRMIQVVIAFLSAVLVCRAQQPASEPKDFSFTQVDLEMLEKSNELDKQLQEKGLVYNDPETTKYISKVGQSVLPGGSELQNVHWQFFVLRDPIPNAFALPNGSIYVHTGLLAILENAAQLAAVLAHEETHVLDRHGYLENRSYRKKAEAGMIIAGVASAGGVAGGAVTGLFLEPAAITVQLAVPAILLSSVNGYGRQLEEDADLRAVHALVDAGYSTEEMKKLFDLLQQDHDVDLSKKSFYQDHPKLQDRSDYVGKFVASLPPRSAAPAVEADRYLIETESAVRHDADLEIRAGRARTAVWVMERVVKRDDKLADNFYVLAEAYRGLGPRTPEPKPEELTNKGKDEARKMMAKMTPEEYEAALLKAPGAQQVLESNERSAERDYRRALDISPDLPGPHRGLGFLYEQEHKPEQSILEFRKYLDLAPSAVDSPQIKIRIGTMEKRASNSSQALDGK